MVNDHSEQQRLSSIALGALEKFEFALAGSGAIREYGLIDRPTQDVDLFARLADITPETFEEAKSALIETLKEEGYQVDEMRSFPLYASLKVSKGGIEQQLEMGADAYSYPPKRLAIGSVIDIRDAVANKIATLFSRGEVRDYLDVYAIRAAGVYSDEELLQLAALNEAGFDKEFFSAILRDVSRLSYEQVEKYGISETELADIKNSLTGWSDEIAETERLESSERFAEDAKEKISDEIKAPEHALKTARFISSNQPNPSIQPHRRNTR